MTAFVLAMALVGCSQRLSRGDGRRGAGGRDGADREGAPPTAVVCLDPGHPSETSEGTRGPGGTSERRVNWRMARLLARALRRRGIAVVMTRRREGVRVANRRRAEIANAAGASLFLRLHCDAGDRSGFAVYHPDRPGTRFGVVGPSPAVIRASGAAARRLHRAMARFLGAEHPSLGVLGDAATLVGSRQGALTGSIFSRVPTVTVEMCVLTNPRDEGFINGAHGRRRMVEALARGVDEVLCPSAAARRPR